MAQVRQFVTKAAKHTAIGSTNLHSSAAGHLQPGLLHCWYVDHAVVTLPHGHRFPRHKHREIRRMLQNESQFQNLSQFHPSPAAPRLDLLRVHPQEYVERFAAGTISSVEMRTIGFPWTESMMIRQFHSSGGTLAACKALLAQPELKVFNDIAVSIKHAQEVHGIECILVIDLDVHQGNGTNSIFQDDPRVVTCDLYCGENYPWSTRTRATHDLALPAKISDEEYLDVLKRQLEILGRYQPKLVIYQAGVDALAEDTLGKMNLSRKALAARNNLVLSFALTQNAPMLITLGGGYARPDATPSIEAHCDVFRSAAFRLGAVKPSH